MTAHDVSQEKRDDAGRWTTGGSIKYLVDKSFVPSPAHRSLYAKSMKSDGSEDERGMFDRTITNMPEHAARCISDNLEKVSFVKGGSQAMRDAYNRLVGSREVLPNERPPLGAYNAQKKQVIVMGGEQDSEKIGNTFGTLQHELGHALDRGAGKGGRFSDSDEWVKAWQEEIVYAKQITDYAGTTASEGFAEFHRLVCHVRDHGGDMGEVEASFPKCCAVWKELGIL